MGEIFLPNFLGLGVGLRVVITIGKPEAACIREGDDGGGIGVVLVGAEVKKMLLP
jgi:hypothetical protein